MRLIMFLTIPGPAVFSTLLYQMVYHTADLVPFWPAWPLLTLSLLFTIWSQKKSEQWFDRYSSGKTARWMFMIAGLLTGPAIELFLY